MEAVKIECPTISKEDLSDFVFESYTVDEECCEKNKPIACKAGDEVYKVPLSSW